MSQLAEIAPTFIEMAHRIVWCTAATVAAVLIALGSALLSARRATAPRRVIEALLALPWAVPGTVFAIALATKEDVTDRMALRLDPKAGIPPPLGRDEGRRVHDGD